MLFKLVGKIGLLPRYTWIQLASKPAPLLYPWVVVNTKYYLLGFNSITPTKQADSLPI